MKTSPWFAFYPMVVVVCLSTGLAQEGRFVDVRPIPGLDATPTSYDTGPTVTADGLTIVFTSSRGGGLGGRDLFIAERFRVDEPFGPPRNLGSPVNSAGYEHNSHISPNGLVLYFASDFALYSASRATRSDPFTNKVSLGNCVNVSNGTTTGPSATDDGLQLFFFSDRSGGTGGYDLWTAGRKTPDEPFCQARPVPFVNSAASEMHCAISANGLALIFDSPNRDPTRANDIWIATRANPSDDFDAPVSIDTFSLGSEINGPLVDYTPSLSPDWPAKGAKLYFSRGLLDYTGQQLYEATWIIDPPEAVIALEPSLSLVDQEIVMDGSGSFSRAPGAILSYRWDFGDGRKAEGAQLRHAYAAPGRYVITLTVADERGITDTSGVSATVVCADSDLGAWTSADVGAPAYPGSTRAEDAGEGGSLVLCAGGHGVSSTGDQLHLTYQQVEGDFQFSSRLTAREGGNVGAGAGLFLRGGLGDKDAFVGLFAETQTTTTPTFITRVRSRAQVGSRPVSKVLSAVPRDGLDAAPLRLRLRRTGDLVSVFVTRSAEGSFIATPDFEATVQFSGPLLVGLAAYGKDLGGDMQPFAALRARFSEITLGPLAARFVRGDSTADGATDVSDAVAILRYLFLGEKKVPCEQAGDANDDGALDISDAVYVLSFLFLGGKPIKPPMDECGIDPTGHDLPCASFPPCE